MDDFIIWVEDRNWRLKFKVKSLKFKEGKEFKKLKSEF